LNSHIGYRVDLLPPASESRSVAKRLLIAGVEYRSLRESYAVMEFAMTWRKDNTSPVVRAFVDLMSDMKRS
jgi:hypothetical protein